MKEKISQTEAIEAMLKAGRRITPLHALNELGCFRLGARILDLRRQGNDIQTEMVRNDHGVRFASYFMPEAVAAVQPVQEGQGVQGGQ